MTARSWQFPLVVFAAMLVAASVSLHHMEHLPALLIIAPGYLVQAWLFVRHHALGGLWYQLTIVGVSAAFWTFLVLLVAGLYRRLFRRGSRRRAA